MDYERETIKKLIEISDKINTIATEREQEGKIKLAKNYKEIAETYQNILSEMIAKNNDFKKIYDEITQGDKKNER